MPPAVDPSLLEDLCELAEQLDGCNPQFEDCEYLRDQFNRLAGTSLQPEDFAFSGATDAETFVRGVLTSKLDLRVHDITREELVELVKRVSSADGAEHEVDYWLELLRVNLPDNRISDLIFWPNEYFADEAAPSGDVESLTPEQIVEISLARRKTRAIPLPEKL